MPAAGPNGPDHNVIQIHPTLRCNLRCLHCYSMSGPHRRDELAPGVVSQVLGNAAREGYNVLGVSGGEPLLYEPLPVVLARAKSLGMATTVTTNGTVFTRERLAAVFPVVDLLAISLDGIGAAHNAMRGAPRAFESLVRGLPMVRNSGVPFGFIVTLTLTNAGDLDEIARFAVDNGAALLQIHPLEEVGYARDNLAGRAPDERELAFAFLEAARIQRAYAGQLTVQFDAVDRDIARELPDRLYAGADGADPADLAEAPLAALIAPVVLEADGVVVPLQYGFDRRFAIGNLDPEGAALRYWKTSVYPRFRALCRATYDAVVSGGSPVTPFANWYGAVSQSSRDVG